ncbi:MAG: hypothetical protein ACI9CA_001756 [Natronomonas sp.]|jgi:hypothetical protein
MENRTTVKSIYIPKPFGRAAVVVSHTVLAQTRERNRTASSGLPAGRVRFGADWAGGEVPLLILPAVSL